MTTLEIKNLSYSYIKNNSNILNKINLTIQPNSFNLLSGSNGVGKSTLFRLMAGLEKPQIGSILINKHPVHTLIPFERAKYISLLFQNPTHQFTMKTAREELEFTLENIQVPLSRIKTKTNQILNNFNLKPLADKPLLQLSGGEQQKIALAIILAMDTDIILLDEPFSNVDNTSRLTLLKLLKKIQIQQNKTIIITDHDLNDYYSLIDNHYQLTSNGLLTFNNNKQLITTPYINFTDNTLLNNGMLHWKNLTLYQNKEILLQPSNFTIPSSSIGLLSGTNGSGKSTLFKTISRMLPLTGASQLTWGNNSHIKDWHKLVGYGFQITNNQFVTLTPAEEFSISLKISQQKDYWTPSFINDCIKQLQLTSIINYNVYKLSGGQQKKVQILSLLILGLPVLLLDEPLSGLDFKSIQQIMTIMQKYTKKTKTSIFMISHQRQGLKPFIDYERCLINKQFVNPTLQ